MSNLINVYDLSFLSRIALAGVEPSINRVAYYAGLKSIFKIAAYFNEKEAESVSSELYQYLSGNIYPRAGQPVDFAKKIAQGTYPKVNISLDIFEQFGLSLGAPGVYYYTGMKNGVTVGMVQVPTNFIYLDGGGWRKPYGTWLGSQILYAGMDMENEMTLIGE